MKQTRSFRIINRRKTNEISVGDVKIGANNPISVQSMTSTLTTDIEDTIRQVNECYEAGAELMRISVPDQESSEALAKLFHIVQFQLLQTYIFITEGRLRRQKLEQNA